MRNKPLIAFIIAVAIFIGGVVVLKSNQDAPRSGMMGTPVLRDGLVAFSTSSIGTSPTLLLATSTGRMMAIICHDLRATSSIAYLHLNPATSSLAASTTVAVGEGYMLEAGECFHIPQDLGFIYTGSIFTIASSSTTSFSITTDRIDSTN